MVAIPGSQGLFRIFYAITGAGILTLFIGFGKCIFDINQINACVDHGQYAFEMLESFGNHVIRWFIALFEEVMSRY